MKTSSDFTTCTYSPSSVIVKTLTFYIGDCTTSSVKDHIFFTFLLFFQ